MSDAVKPGPEASAASPETTPLDAATQNTTTQTPTAPPPASEIQPVAESLPANAEEFKARLEAERAKVLNEYRAKAGAEGGWMANLAPEDREFIKTNPWAIREMKAKIEGYENAMRALGKSEPQTQEPDPLEAEATELVELAAKQDISPADFYRKMVGVTQKIARREAEKVHEQKFQPSYQTMTRQQQETAVVNDPRWKDPRVQKMTKGIIVDSGGRTMPLVAMEEACQAFGLTAPTNGNGHSPRATPALGETRSIATPANTPSLSIAERFARTASGRRMLGKE